MFDCSAVSPVDIAYHAPGGIPRSLAVSQRNQHQGFKPGFTVVELLVVIGAITILVGILFVSIGFVHRSMKERQTKLQLGNLKGMLVELDTANGLKTSPP